MPWFFWISMLRQKRQSAKIFFKNTCVFYYISFLGHSQIQKNSRKNDRVPTFFYVKVFRWTGPYLKPKPIYYLNDPSVVVYQVQNLPEKYVSRRKWFTAWKTIFLGHNFRAEGSWPAGCKSSAQDEIWTKTFQLLLSTSSCKAAIDVGRKQYQPKQLKEQNVMSFSMFSSNFK